ncbi:MAG: S-layer homology domain-containing protein [Clostridia bacterium]|nr:S-layer homology domain-containing protein [Clostridia bacterium]
MKKRIFAFILCAIMLVGILPITSSAAYALDYVKIDGLSAPMEGAAPDYTVAYDNTVTLSAGNNNPSYYKNGICWYDMTTASTIRTTAKFVAGHQYKAVLYVEAINNYAFTSAPTVMVDDRLAVEVYRFDDTRIVVEVVFEPIPQFTPIASIEYYTDRRLISGNELETVTLVRINGTNDFGAMLKEWDGAWYVNDTKTDNPADYEKYTGSVYVPNVSFAYRAEITLKGEYVFTEQSDVSLNFTNYSVTGLMQSLSADSKTAVFYFFADPLTAQPIKSVAYTLEGYEFGSPINGITIDSSNAVNTDGAYGTDYFITVANRIPITEGNFEADTTYTLRIAVTSNVYDVSSLEKQNITLNGKTATNVETVNGVLYAIFYLPALEAQDVEIYSILLAVDVEGPKAGQSFFYPTVYAVNGEESLASAVTLADIGEDFGWYVSDYFVPDAYYEYVTDTDKFEEGKAYLFFATIDALPGYTIAPGCYVTISTPNGLMEGELYDAGTDYIQNEFYCNLGAPDTAPKLESVSVELDGYGAGKAIQDIIVIPTVNGVELPYIPDGENPLYGMFYGVLNENKDFIPEGVFEYNADYYLSVLLSAGSYDTGSLDKSKFTLNGKAADSVEVRFGMIEITFKLSRLTLNPFIDVKENHWFAASVAYCVERGYVTGMTENTFVPNGKLTRAQFLTILAKLDGVDLTQYDTEDAGFADVKTGHWYNEVVCWAVEKGYTSGLSTEKFGPNVDITRAQLARFFYVYSEKNGINIDGRADISSFPDVKKVADWARTPVEWAVKAGLISGVAKEGKNYLDPNGTATRAQATVMFKAYDDFRGVNG